MSMSPKRVSEHSTQWRNTFRTMAIVVFTMLVVWGVIITALIKANFWFAEPGVLKELRLQHPSIDSVMKVERNMFSRSVVTVHWAEGRTSDFFLDSDILFNYELKEKS